MAVYRAFDLKCTRNAHSGTLFWRDSTMGETLYTLEAIARRWHTTPKRARTIIDKLPTMAGDSDWDYALWDGSLLWPACELHSAEKMLPELEHGKGSKVAKQLRHADAVAIRRLGVAVGLW
jgi:hypothetical protein